ncbi:DUF7537 family lipoprotein [Halococcus hamelinensis]|uniref:Uncharacterized protein n=1 Tax=Halococcus hamelinensis 100A6 TaxID=1132509 RepID=M0M1D2_9EURY|nr:hypothetical protein [Halococcus hamelinensis]EMA39617.1 hypothetical protein C447_06556 [Halococcus hamelinensis 100A6]
MNGTHHPILVWVVALALVLTGCNGFVPGDGPSTETVTPVAVPTDEPTPTPTPQLAPGLEEAGVTDPFELGEAHAAALDDRSFTVHSETTVRFANGSVYRHDERIGRFAANRSRYDVSSNGSGSVPIHNVSYYSVEAWSDGSQVLTAQRIDENASYDVRRGLDGSPASVSEGYNGFFRFEPGTGQAVYTLFGATETRFVGETRRNGNGFYQVTATNVTNPNAFADVGTTDLRYPSLRALVAPNGLVREYRLDYTATLDDPGNPNETGRTVHVDRWVSYTDVGTTSIERPPWYDEAVANASTATTTG